MRRMCVLSDCPVGAVAVLMLADQMLSRVEYVHSKSFLHRSVFLTWWLGLVVVLQCPSPQTSLHNCGDSSAAGYV